MNDGFLLGNMKARVSCLKEIFLAGALKKASSKVFEATHKGIGLWLPEGLGRVQWRRVTHMRPRAVKIALAQG